MIGGACRLLEVQCTPKTRQLVKIEWLCRGGSAEEGERMTTQRKRYSAECKARMAFEALTGEKPRNELASE